MLDDPAFAPFDPTKSLGRSPSADELKHLAHCLGTLRADLENAATVLELEGYPESARRFRMYREYCAIDPICSMVAGLFYPAFDPKPGAQAPDLNL